MCEKPGYCTVISENSTYYDVPNKTEVSAANHLPVNPVSHPRRHKSSLTMLWEPQIMHITSCNMGMQLSVAKTRKEKIKCVRGKCFGYVIRIRTACGKEKCMPKTNLCSNAIYTIPKCINCYFVWFPDCSDNLFRYISTTAKLITHQTWQCMVRYHFFSYFIKILLHWKFLK